MLTVILKGTNACNLRCKYCCLGDKSNYKFVNKSKLIEIFDYIGEYATYNSFEKVCIIFHGGEPLLISTDMYSEAMEYIMDKFKNLYFRWNIQTNGTIVDDKKIDFFRKYDINIGISIDGNKLSHDKVRIFENGSGTYDKVWNNIIKLKENNISCSGIMVLSSAELNDDFSYLDSFTKNRIALKINPLISCGEVDNNLYLELKKYDYAKYLISVFKYILKNDLDIVVSPIDKILNAIINKQPVRECIFSEQCSQRFIAIDYNGDIYPCGRFVDQSSYKLGNISEKKYRFRNKEYINLIQRKNLMLPEDCKACKYKKYCNAGCSAEANISSNILEKTQMCDDYKMIFEYFESEGLELLIKQLEIRKHKLELKIRKLEGK